jgi:hypothetical protein
LRKARRARERTQNFCRAAIIQVLEVEVISGNLKSLFNAARKLPFEEEAACRKAPGNN